MSTHVNSLRKQNELLQAEVEVYADAVDRLAEQLAQAQRELNALRPPLGDESETDEPEIISPSKVN
ncbi:hypothetical protein [Rhizobium sp. RCC_161_2]|uniref:hypothetical protein n=1 Tax=Rhizobium sp. RCC_161_2 TaxID=3239219 RepID=UPI003523B029